MFNPNSTMIDAFVGYTLDRFNEAYPQAPDTFPALLETSARSALEILLGCDCPYHDVQHTMLVTDVGQTMLRGRQLSNGDITAHDWLHAVIGMLFHDVGYVRDLLKDDDDTSCVVDRSGNRVTPPTGCTDAYMTPYHVTRGSLYVQERFANVPEIDVPQLQQCIEITSFPVPRASAADKVGVLPQLVRAADLLGQMADPMYLKKLSRLYAEFIETGEAQRQGFANAGELRAKFPQFFENQVRPFVGEGLKCLGKTQDGQPWIANLIHHLHADHDLRQVEPQPDWSVIANFTTKDSMAAAR